MGLKVSQISKYIENLLKRDSFLTNLSVEGEVSNLTFSAGLVFFKIKDEHATLSCIIFRNKSHDLIDKLKNGGKIIARGSINIYEKTSSYQLIVRDVDQIGHGEIYENFLKLRSNLKDEGLFDLGYKKKLKTVPSKIGLLTSENGAALYDVLNVIERRFPKLDIYFYPVNVQGINACEDLIKGIDILDLMDLDLILITRGGGSFEDLLEFNNEILARKVFSAKTPVVSAIGHEVDTTIIELVSDLRAATPTEAAEKISPNIVDMKKDLEININRIIDAKSRLVRSLEIELSYIYKNLTFLNPLINIDLKLDNLNKAFSRLDHIIDKQLLKKESELMLLDSKLEKYNLDNMINKGHCFIKKDGLLINSIDNIEPNDNLTLLMKDGLLKVKVKDKVKYEN